MASPVWQFFEVSKTNVRFAICNTCNKDVNRGGTNPKDFNTTNLIRHLRSFHLVQYDEYTKLASSKTREQDSAKKLMQLSVTEALPRQQPYSKEVKKYKEISTRVMEFICLCHQPLSIVESAGFKRLLSYMDPRYSVPSRKYFSDICLPQLYQTVYSHIDTLLKDDVAAISFTSDIWTSSVCPMSMLSLTAQFIDHEFKLHQVILHCREFPGSHTGEAIATAFEDMLKSWGISKEKVHVILRDNARNMEKAMKDANLPSLPCMAHTLQLAVSEGILSQRTISDILAAARRIVGHFKHSQVAYTRLHELQVQLGQPQKRLQQDIATRWNSTFYMLQSLVEQKRTISAYAAEYELPCTLTNNQWKLAENMMVLLAPFEELTQQISSSNASASDVIPSVKALIRFLEKTEDSDHGVKTSKSTLLEAVKRRFADIESQHLYSIATILDPRYKDRYFTDALKPQIRKALSDALAIQPKLQEEDTVSSKDSDSPEPPAKTARVGTLHAMFTEMLEESVTLTGSCGTVENPTASQMNLYLSEPVMLRNGQPLVYWKENESRFPALARAARVFLCAPCTSVDSERLFSTAGIILDDKRNKLTPQNAEMLIFLKKNLPLIIST